MDNPVASRVLNCLFGGNREKVVVRLGRPREEDGYFSCEYEISFAGRSETHKIAGADGVHALQLALFMIGSALHSLPGTSNWTWNGEPYTGFPTNLDQPVIGLRS
jgi:hypothetical protein